MSKDENKTGDFKNPFALLTENTGISLSLLFIFGGFLACVGGWAYNQTIAMNEIRYELKELRVMIQTQWTRQDHDIWAMQLALRNPNIFVPMNPSIQREYAPTK